MTVKDAEAFIRNALESDIRGNNNIHVHIEPNIKAFELFPCLVAAQDAYTQCPPECSKIVAAMKALREAAKERGMDLPLADAKAVVEAFIEV